MTRLFFCCLLVFYNSLPAVAQPARKAFDPARLIPADDLRADFRLMRGALEATHPGLYWYTPKDSLDTVFDRAYAKLARPLTEQGFMNVLYPVLCRIRCGHTQLEHSAAYQQSPNRSKAVHLPVNVFVREGRAWLLPTASSGALIKAGDELVSLNGVPTTDIIRTGMNAWNGDGFNQTWKTFFLNEYGLFEEVCRTVYGWTGPYALRVRQPDGTIRSLTLPAPLPAKPATSPTRKTATARHRSLAPPPADSHASGHLALRWLADSLTAVLTVAGLAYGDEAFYERAFRQIEQRHVKNLVLDIRRNHGGDGRIVNNLLSYLADSSYVFLRRILTKTANPAQNSFAAQFDPDLTASYRATFGPARQEGDWYEADLKPDLGHLMGYQAVAPHYRYRQNLYVLIDGGTFSNGANFAAALKAYRKHVVFIGRETGGTESGCGGGTNNKLTLPHSGLVLQIPWMRLVSATTNPVEGHGLLPDYPVDYPPAAVADHRDLDLEQALALIMVGRY